MGRKIRRVPYGSEIRDIWRLFIEPAIKRLTYAEDQTLLSNGVPIFFDAEHREVWAAKAKANFLMPGQTKNPDNGLLYNSFDDRRVTKKDELFVRFDLREKHKIEIEHNDIVYTLTPFQWERIKEKVELFG